MTREDLRSIVATHTGNCHCVYCMADFEIWSRERREAERQGDPKAVEQMLRERGNG